MIRHLKVARDTAVKSRTQAMVTLKTLIVNAPAVLRQTLDALRGKMALIRHLAALRPGPMISTVASAKTALRAIARRWLTLDAEIRAHDGPMTPDGTPVIGATTYPGLYLNTGHGTLGWTIACGSGRVLADLLTGVEPEIETADLSLNPVGSAPPFLSQIIPQAHNPEDLAASRDCRACVPGPRLPRSRTFYLLSGPGQVSCRTGCGTQRRRLAGLQSPLWRRRE